jgi:ADP-dependent NAD(P)H-hydrate dehydratase / NAD(P)H-hydrate epimerase
MKILNKEQIYQADKYTIDIQDITSGELMERAGYGIYEWIDNFLVNFHVPIHIFCGVGNNGGDGLVAARYLIESGYDVHTYIVNFSNKRSKDFLSNLEQYANITDVSPVFISDESDFPELMPGDFVIDAIFGIGLSKPVPDWLQNLFTHINFSKTVVIAIDMPSGLPTDKAPDKKSEVVKAQFTLGMGVPKLAYLLPETAQYVGEFQIIDIGLQMDFLDTTESEIKVLGILDILKLFKLRMKHDHKGTYGHSLIIGGSYGKIGSVILASRAVLRAGGGLVTAFIPKCGYQILQTALPEAMVITDTNDSILTDLSFEIQPTVIGIGIGMGTDTQTVSAFKRLLKAYKSPMVIDADGLNILANHPKLMDLMPQNSVLTPHIGELKRLIGVWKDDYHKLEKVKDFCKKYKVILVVKGPNSMITDGSDIVFNNTGNNGMATAGSGDVLTGVITGLISQGYEPWSAAIFGVHLHGKSADLLVENSTHSLIASDIIDNLQGAFDDIMEEAVMDDDPLEEDFSDDDFLNFSDDDFSNPFDDDDDIWT